MQATGTMIKEDKSSAIALGSWTKMTPILNIKYFDDIKILGFNVTANIKESSKILGQY